MGRVKDPGLRCLLRELARHNPGLVVITTRLAVDDLKDFTGSTVVEMDLEHLSPVAGAAYLAHLGVKGTDEELQRASDEFGGHALALTLLGRYLATVYDGDVRCRDQVARLTDERRQGAHARRVLESYQHWLAGQPELDILRLMGLFDRPAEQGALEALITPPAIQGLTDRLQNLSRADWQYALDDLRAARLLAAPDPHAPGSLDCHPLLREHFAEQLRADNPEAWREAHGRLYEYYAAAAEERPDTIEGLAPLYAAVAHGCQAGRHQEALVEVYGPRIRRGDEAFSLKKLGAFGAGLAALAGFFDPPWRLPVAGLGEGDKAFVLNEAGFHLRALGRLAEAAQPMQVGLEIRIAQEKWESAAIIAGNLSELYLAGGDLAQALERARQSVELADRSDDAFQRMSKRTTLANALHQAGRRAEAEATFAEAEAMQEAHQPQFPLLYSRAGFQYYDLLLSQGQYETVQSRVEKLFKWRQPSDPLLDIALEHLSLGRAYLLATQAGRGEGDYAQAAAHLERALDGLRRAGYQEFITRGLLARAELRLATGALEGARRDVDAALSIAERGGMRLHQADCHLAYARLHLAGGQKELARDSLAQAKAIVGETGYHRRDGEIEALEKKLRILLLPE